MICLLMGLALTTPAVAQTAGGRWEARSPQYYSIPQTAWVRTEVLSPDSTSQQVGAAITTLLRQHGFEQGPGGSYAMRLEMHGRGLTTPSAPIPGYSNATSRLSIWSTQAQDNAVYVSLLLYHQSTGQVFWQGEAMCVGLPADPRDIVNAMVGPLMGHLGRSGDAALGCRPL